MLVGNTLPSVCSFRLCAGVQVKLRSDYSPNFNPIEKAWPKMKEAVREARARTTDARRDAVNMRTTQINKIVRGRIAHIVGDEVWIEVDSEHSGAVPLEEFSDEVLDAIVPPLPGQVVRVLIEAVVEETGGVVLSYRKARPCLAASEAVGWQHIHEGRLQEGHIVRGTVVRKVEEGLVVQLSIQAGAWNGSLNALLPMSEVDIRPGGDVDLYVGKTIECKIVKIDEVLLTIIVGAIGVSSV
jgi:small subunit ribosomal protein S1